MSGILHNFDRYKFLAASLINNEHSDQERDNFCKQYWKIFPDEIFHTSNIKFFRYLLFWNGKKLPFLFSYDVIEKTSSGFHKKTVARGFLNI